MANSAETAINRLSAQPLWLEGTILVSYEPATLPLLFSPIPDFEKYMSTLRKLQPTKAHEFDALRAMYIEARSALDEGNDDVVMALLGQGVAHRRSLFQMDDYQVTAAEFHFALTIVHFATLLVRQQQYDLAYRYFTLAKAQISSKLLPGVLNNPNSRHLFFCVLQNNWANYWMARGKQHQALECSEKALQAFELLPNKDPLWHQYFRSRMWSLQLMNKQHVEVLAHQDQMGVKSFDLILWERGGASGESVINQQRSTPAPDGPMLELHMSSSVEQYVSDCALNVTTGVLSLYCRALAIRDMG
eukprot:PhF_6_TR36528/c0_g1_i1/m.53836